MFDRLSYIDEKLEKLNGLTWALDCVVSSMETRGLSSHGLDGVATFAITDTMQSCIDGIRVMIKGIEQETKTDCITCAKAIETLTKEAPDA